MLLFVMGERELKDKGGLSSVLVESITCADMTSTETYVWVKCEGNKASLIRELP